MPHASSNKTTPHFPPPLMPRSSLGQARLVTYLDNLDTERLGTLREHINLQARLVERVIQFSVAPFDDTSWRDAWKAFFKPAQVSPRLAIRAPWAEFDAPPGVEVLMIEPGMAFGTGLHETTRLCLQAVDRYAPAQSVLDVGAGPACSASVQRVWVARASCALTMTQLPRRSHKRTPRSTVYRRRLKPEPRPWIK